MLAKLGVPSLVVYDDDAVESQNIPIAAYGRDDLGLRKPVALGRRLANETGTTVVPVTHAYTGEPLRSTIVACVDSMEARQCIWKAVRKNLAVDLLIDTRVAEELVTVYAIDPNDDGDIAFYEPFLAYGSREAAIQTCGRHGLPHVAAAAAVAVCGNLTNWWGHGRKKRLFTFLARELQVVGPDKDKGGSDEEDA